jgi:archaellum biogenesis ATPase FlaH
MEMERKMMEDKHVLGRLAIQGQSTMLYAPPNAGKTLITLRLLCDAIAAGVIKGEDVFYVNADDTYKGLVHKLRVAERYGFHQLAPGHGRTGGPVFKAEDLETYLNKLIEAETAAGKILILDTVKKFVDLMSKEKSSKFMEAVRQFISHGGTVIMLAHVNKHRDDNKKLIYAGTADSVDDCDCAYTLDVVSKDFNTGICAVKFENFKARGDVALEAYYSYAFSNEATWFEKFESVAAIDEDERKKAEAKRQLELQMKKNQVAVDAITDCINDGITKKTELIAEASARSGISKPKITKVLLGHTGTDTSKNKFWFERVGEHNTKTYSLNYGSSTETTGGGIEKQEN